MRHALLPLVIAALCGCASAPPQVLRQPVEVRVPVPVPCVAAADLPVAPALASDAELARLDDARLVWAIEQQRRELRQYQTRAAALLAVCAQPGTRSANSPKEQQR